MLCGKGGSILNSSMALGVVSLHGNGSPVSPTSFVSLFPPLFPWLNTPIALLCFCFQIPAQPPISNLQSPPASPSAKPQGKPQPQHQRSTPHKIPWEWMVRSSIRGAFVQSPREKSACQQGLCAMPPNGLYPSEGSADPRGTTSSYHEACTTVHKTQHSTEHPTLRR